MNGLFLVIISALIFVLAYRFYGAFIAAKVLTVNQYKVTPAFRFEDGHDYVPTNKYVVFGHHFAAIAGAGPLVGPVFAAQFGYLPGALWILIGGVLAGAVHDMVILFASMRYDGKSIAEIANAQIGDNVGLATSFAVWFLNILAMAGMAVVIVNALHDSPWGTFTIGMTIPIAIFVGVYMQFLRPGHIKEGTVIGVALTLLAVILGPSVSASPTLAPLFTINAKGISIALIIYGFVAAALPVWLLLAPRDYLSTYMKIGTIGALAIGIIIVGPTIQMPAMTQFVAGGGPVITGPVLPYIFITIACGAISGFHSLVGSGTTAKQLNNEKDAQPIAYGGMLIECVLALVSLCAVAYIWQDYKAGTTVTPTVVFATGLSQMLGKIFGSGAVSVTFTLMVLAVSVFCLTSLDTATRLARYMFQEFWRMPGEMAGDPTVTGARKVLCNPYVSTAITVVLGIALGMTGYAKIWPLFVAANQRLAGLGLLAVAAWLGKMGRNNKMFYFPMIFMILVTLTSLVFTIKSQITAIIAGSTGVAWCYIRAILAILLVILAIALVVEGSKALAAQAKAKKAA